MTDPRSVFRSLLVYSVCLPLALVLGYMLATPLDFTSFVTITIVLLALLFPILLRWHHPLLVFSWHTVAVLPFLPGRPQIRLLLTVASLLLALLMYALDRRARPLNVPSVTRPLLFLSAVVLTNMVVTGGAGFNVFGSQVGGAGRYVALAGAILGYFALSARPIPPEKAGLYTGLFFLGGLTLAISSLATVMPRSFQYLFLIFPVERTALYAPSPTGVGVPRMYGVALASMSVIFYMLARYGMQGVFRTTKPWRAVLFLGFLVGVMFGGYRAFVILVLGVLAFQFYLEGLFKMKFLPAWLVIAAAMVSILPIMDRLPYPVQRSFAWIPGLAAPHVRADARASTEWRLQIWQRAVAEVPHHLLLGKGYALDLRDLEMAQFRRLDPLRGRGELEAGEAAELAGDYHNGPLSVIIPLGVLGVVGVGWFFVASWRLLLHNYRHSPPELKIPNTFLLAFFCARVVYFLAVFGSLYAEFYYFTGLVAFSVALNHGMAVARPTEATVTTPSGSEQARLLRPALSPVAPMRT